MNRKRSWKGYTRLPVFLCARIFIERETSGYEAITTVWTRLLVETSLYPLIDIFVFHVWFFFWRGGGYSNNLLIHLIKFCFVFVCLIVSCFLKRILHFFLSLGHNLFFRRQSITKVNIKKSKQQNSKNVSNALIWLLKLLLCFVALLFLIIILSVIYWPQKKKNPSITDVSSKFLQFIYRCMLAYEKF